MALIVFHSNICRTERTKKKSFIEKFVFWSFNPCECLLQCQRNCSRRAQGMFWIVKGQYVDSHYKKIYIIQHTKCSCQRLYHNEKTQTSWRSYLRARWWVPLYLCTWTVSKKTLFGSTVPVSGVPSDSEHVQKSQAPVTVTLLYPSWECGWNSRIEHYTWNWTI